MKQKDRLPKRDSNVGSKGSQRHLGVFLAHCLSRDIKRIETSMESLYEINLKFVHCKIVELSEILRGEWLQMKIILKRVPVLQNHGTYQKF